MIGSFMPRLLPLLQQAEQAAKMRALQRLAAAHQPQMPSPGAPPPAAGAPPMGANPSPAGIAPNFPVT
ncbi:hypothetical protein SAMN05445871_4036 [Paraburkholderia caballeronis]|uniref:Uncharacterized protein n=1 Tax=Paraburkholderia caballeronis TaxID=416943 RepID=A0A1H7L1B0_9BURK|nr:hypothetical protein C7403_102143 [Paraburkholderia caballeronis]PXX03617.1 hypothetical protein C7407_102143 [Paraburkholderia caballeronis]RAK04361.1 hypothetical protein C7409_102143 [Paraburkholderia caballeronis]SED83261.1 hypothetical protein SAMN05445871_4036 [Paraburkholderia caballeronis]SEK92768.1 hypothetical protein SAMN05192542_104143 [Paraburkholderia caballeronis]